MKLAPFVIKVFFCIFPLLPRPCDLHQKDSDEGSEYGSVDKVHEDQVFRSLEPT